MRVALRPITDADHPYVLELNETHVEMLSPLTDERLRQLRGWAHRADLIEVDGAPAGFVLTFTEGSSYDSFLYAAMAERFDRFGYLDRVVVDPAFRRRGVARAVYDALEAAYRDRGRMTLEVNLEPPNEPSLAFHRSRGYADLGRLDIGGGKVVQLMTKALGVR